MIGEMKVFSGTSHQVLAGGIAAHIGMPLGKVKFTRFSNENIKVKIDENVREADVFVIQTSCPPVSDNLMEMLSSLTLLSMLRRRASRLYCLTIPTPAQIKRMKPAFPSRLASWRIC